jgi:hypothetical protein
MNYKMTINPKQMSASNLEKPQQACKSRALLLVSLALLVMILAVYWQTGSHEFLNFDDEAYVTANPHVVSGISGKNMVWAFTSFEEANWHPLTWLSHMMDVQLHGLNPRGHHLTSVVIHCSSSLVLLLFLFRLTGGLWPSALVAALFALHPLHVESVAWIAERKDVLSGFFWFLTLYLYVGYTANRKAVLYVLALVSFLLGLMAKPMLVTLPIVLLLLDYWPLGRFSSRAQEEGQYPEGRRWIALLQEKIPFCLAALISSAVTLYAQQAGGAVPAFTVFPLSLRMENVLTSYVKYLGKTFWPHDLAVYYPFPRSVPLWQVSGSLLCLLFLSLIALRAGRRNPLIALGWFWFIVTLVPVIGLVQVGGQAMADRYSYLPITGVFIMVAWGGQHLVRKWPGWQGLSVLLAAIIITALSVATWRQLGYWRDNISLYRHTLRVTTDNDLIHYNLGMTLARDGYLDAAIREYREAIRIQPRHFGAHNNLGIALAGKGELDAAIGAYKEAIRINRHGREAHNNLGVVLAAQGDLSGAIREFREALRLSPDYMDARNNLQRALAQSNNH